MEEVKRLTPKDAVVRKLFFASGNQCAYPECKNLIVNENGALIGQICHIEAASEGGERFNPEMSNEERRSYKNLVLLCYEHHVVTNDVKKYSVKKLKKMKKDHEGKFKSILTGLQDSALKDITKNQGIIFPKTLHSMNDVLEWGHGPSELEGTLSVLKSEVEKLKKLTRKHRSVFYTMLERSDNGIVLLDEIQEVLNLSDNDIRSYIDVLNKYSFISEPERSEDHYNYVSEIEGVKGFDWNLWLEIKFYCNETEDSLEEMIINLDFQKLD